MNEDQIEIRSVVKFLWLKDYNNKDIYEEICSVYGEEKMTLREIQNRIKSLEEGNHSLFDKVRSGRPLKNDLIDPISHIMEEDPYISTKKLAKKLNVAKQTIKRILIEELHMVKINFKWVPYTLNENIRKQRIEMAKKLLHFLTTASEKTLDQLMTQDETWIYLNNPRKTMWIKEGHEPPINVKQNIGSKKVMISVIWSRTGVKSITMLPPGQKFNKEFYLDKVIGNFAKKYKTNGKIFHMDNARPHLVTNELKKMGIRRLDHPPYSPDIAPSDFFLFGFLSFQLEGCYFNDENELLCEVKNILTSLSSIECRKAIDSWINRLRMVIDRDGAYVP